MFQKIKKSLLLAAILLLPMGNVQAMEPTMGTENITPGMRGYAKTVILGSNIQTFDIEIIGVIKDGSQSEGRILAKASGDVIEQSGGVLQGMSGSPVYIDGYLVGAVSGGWKNIDNRICTITPIGDMLKIWELPDEKSQRKIPQVNIKEALAKKAVAADKADEVSPKEKVIVNDILNEKPLTTPLMVGGLSAKSMDFLQNQLEPYQLVPYNAGVNGSMTLSHEHTIEPGSSVGVQLVRGDISIAAIGTVTAVDEDRILAFGHSFLHRGNVGYFMTEADIISTASGVNNGFKIGVPGAAIGTINQDRDNGVAGKLGRFPQVIPMQVVVDDKGTASNKRYDVQVAYHEELVPALAATIVYNAMEKSMDTATEGTVKIDFEIATNDAGGDKINRENMYYAAQNVSQLSINELADILNVLCSNTTKEADIYNVKVNISIDNKRKTASIVEAKPDKTTVKPGDTVNLTLKLKPYRGGKNEEVIIPFKIPKGTAPGPVMLEARGGGLVAVAQLALAGVDLSPEEDKTKTVEASIKEMLDKNKNNEIIIDMLAVPAVEGEKNKSSKKTGDKAPAVSKPAKQTVDYVIDNVIRTGLTIEKAK